ncbi:aminotransferase class V-fold PLP-dependent enzyme [Pelagicoccus sp. SDUM812005]|uniref:aminotransferase class V-fold PLP-dependent enzyme n=1 Tax=Pelagicoccus sp. SDUM812005 TaxID=3041257 RepID=UPI00280F9D28|nr:aminotransferase class V-fold PLP-dependent enzyme [Pelagicoccus sp. SDUM812005]MDQ8182625.1 aminotransferase class V-fold PLP-dependent enzyme [Pelagicoccus sp. SDUM812005]
MERRDFLRRSALGGAALGTGLLSKSAWGEVLPKRFERGVEGVSALARDEAFWRARRREFAPAPDFINLEYGYFCPAPLPVLEAEQKGSSEINARASYFMRREMWDEMETTRAELAALAGVDAGEVCITRNTTESMNIIVQGLDLEAGDEIVYSDQDYGSMVEALRQKQERFGIVLKQTAVPLHPESDEEVVAAFEQAITPRTRALHVTHMINLTGHVLPVRKICDMAHARGVEVIVDSAHAFAHVDYKVSDLDCDYLGTSLHKWLCSPVGLGMLYVKKEKIPKLWGLMGDTVRADDDIRKLERLGTRPYNHHRGLREAIRYHEAIGAAEKYERLRYLNTYWTQHFRDHERVVLKTPAASERHGAIANVGIEGVDPKVLGEFLYDRYSILTAPIPNHPVASGVRITPGLPTPLRHLDRLVEAIDSAAKVL